MQKVNKEFTSKFKIFEKDMIEQVAHDIVYSTHFTHLLRHQVTPEHIHQCCSIGTRGMEMYTIPLFYYKSHNHRYRRKEKENKFLLEIYKKTLRHLDQTQYNQRMQTLNESHVVRDYFSN
tara:strand:- start:447 stop:806 length:360 start_codon:yes stop_codon:yes gene_type:complete